MTPNMIATFEWLRERGFLIAAPSLPQTVATSDEQRSLSSMQDKTLDARVEELMQTHNTEGFSRGFDAGNYGNAYESQDWNTWSAKRKLNGRSHAYRSGALLGFFSTYEINEIPLPLQNTLAQLRSKHGEE